MSASRVKIRLANAIRPDLSPIEVEAVTDHEQPCLQLPARLAARLGLKAARSRSLPDANGQRDACPRVGPLQVQLGGQLCCTGAMVNGSRVRVGLNVLLSMSPVTSVPTVFLRD